MSSDLYSLDNNKDFDKDDVEFFKKHKILELIDESLLNLCHSRPQDPFQYLIDFFSNEESKVINLSDLERELCLVDYKSSLFTMIIHNIYNKIYRTANYKGITKKDEFVPGELVLDIMDHILRNTDESSTLLKRIVIKPYIHVTFNTFRYLIIVTLSFKEYIGISNKVYDAITETKNSKVKFERISYSVVLSRLNQWLDNFSNLESCNESNIKNRDIVAKKQNNDSMTRNQFNSEATNIFLSKKTDDPIESKPIESGNSLVYKIGSGIIGGVFGVASSSFNIVKSGSSLIYNNIPLTSWSAKSDESNNQYDNTFTSKKSDEKAGWSLGFNKRKDKSD